MLLATQKNMVPILLAVTLIVSAGDSMAAAVSTSRCLVQADSGEESSAKPAEKSPAKPAEKSFAKPAEKSPAKEGQKPSPLNGLLIQPGDSALRPFRPAKPLSVEDRKKMEALTWFSVGRMHQKRGEFQKALHAYQNATKSDPQSIAILEALIPLSLTLNRTDEAIEYAKRAVEIDPARYRLLQLLGRTLIRQGQLPAAIKMFEQAVTTRSLDKHSMDYVEIQRSLGILYQAAGASKKAAGAFEVVFKAVEDPKLYHLDFRFQKQILADVATNYEQLGNAFFVGGRLELAIQSYRRALETKTGNAGNVSYNLARAYIATKQPELALKELQKYFDAQRQSKGRSAYELLAAVLKAQGKSAELLPRLQTLAEKDKRNSILQFYYAEVLLEAEELDKAETVLDRTLKNSAEPEGFAVLASIHRRRNQPDKLLRSLARAYAINNSLRAVAGELDAIGKDAKLVEAVIAAGRKLQDDQMKFSHAYVLANLALLAEKADVAEEFYRTALSKTRVADQKNAAYLALSELLRGERKYSEAARVLRQGIDDSTFIGDAQKRIFFHYLLSLNLELGGNTEEAIDAIGEAMKLTGQPGPALKLREAWVYLHSEQYDRAIPLFEQIIKDFARDKDVVRNARSSLSNLYVQKGEMRKGEEILEQIFKEQPDDPGVNNDLGYLYADQGKNLEQAEEMIRKALKANPENAAFLDSIGWVLYKREKYQEALPHLEKAAGKDSGQDATIYDHLGDVYLRLKQIEKAAESWTKALKLAEQDARPNKKLIGQLKEKLGDKK